MAQTAVIPVLQAGQTHTFAARAIAWLKGEIAAGVGALTDFVNHKAFPFIAKTLGTIALDVQAKLAPQAEAALEALGENFAVLMTKGWAGFMEAEGHVLTHLLQQAEVDIKDATITDLRIASHSAVLNRWLALGGTAVAA